IDRLLGSGATRAASMVDAVLRRAMSPRPESRFDTVATFFRALEDAAARASEPAAQAEPARALEAAAAPEPEPVAAETPASGESGIQPGEGEGAAVSSEEAAVSRVLERLPRRRGPVVVVALLG